MKKNNVIIVGFASMMALIACSEIPKEAYFKRGQPEGLLESRTQEVAFDIRSKASVSDIAQWARKAKPTHASLHCLERNKYCNKVESMLLRNGVKVTREVSPANDVIFEVEQVTVRKCENRYIDNAINPYNLNYTTFGCSLASNAAQMVTDKRQFTNPDLMDKPDARKSVQTTDTYATAAKPDTDFKTLTTSESLSTGSSGR